jgi:hypothetical protein
MPRKTGGVRADFRRKSKNHKETRDRILIICEDGKRSVEYFEALCTDLELTSADVRVCGKECGSAPSSVYKYAKEAIDTDIIAYGRDNAFDRAYCVFDKDNHADYQRTLSDMKRNKGHKNIPVIPIACIPCFELWILLHFEASGKHLEPRELPKEIKKYLPKFKKESTSYSELYYQELKEKTAQAIKYSKIALKQTSASGTDNPSTNLHILIEDVNKESKK